MIELEKSRSEKAARSAQRAVLSTPNAKMNISNPFVLSPQELESLEVFETKGRKLNFNFATATRGDGGSSSNSSSGSGGGSHSEVNHKGGVNISNNKSNKALRDNGDDGSQLVAVESKVDYIRHMVLQYLTCLEPEVKLKMETAFEIMFRFTAEERQAVEERRRFDSEDALDSITGLFALPSFSLTSS